MLRMLLIVSALLMLSLWTVTGQPEFDYGSDYSGNGDYECDITDPYYGTSCDDWVWDWWGDNIGDGDPDTFDFYSDYYPEDYW